MEVHRFVTQRDAQICLDTQVRSVGEMSALSSGRRPFTPERFLVFICYRLSLSQDDSAAGSIRSLEKNTMTSSGIEPSTFQLLAECLQSVPKSDVTHCTHGVCLVVRW
jgi:hypothetical protein